MEVMGEPKASTSMDHLNNSASSTASRASSLKVKTMNTKKLSDLRKVRMSILKRLNELKGREMNFDDLDKEEGFIRQEEAYAAQMRKIDKTLKRYEEIDANEEKLFIYGTGFQGLDDRLTSLINQKLSATDPTELAFNLNLTELEKALTDQYNHDLTDDACKKKVPAPGTTEFENLRIKVGNKLCEKTKEYFYKKHDFSRYVETCIEPIPGEVEFVPVAAESQKAIFQADVEKLREMQQPEEEPEAGEDILNANDGETDEDDYEETVGDEGETSTEGEQGDRNGFTEDRIDAALDEMFEETNGQMIKERSNEEEEEEEDEEAYMKQWMIAYEDEEGNKVNQEENQEKEAEKEVASVPGDTVDMTSGQPATSQQPTTSENIEKSVVETPVQEPVVATVMNGETVETPSKESVSVETTVVLTECVVTPVIVELGKTDNDKQPEPMAEEILAQKVLEYSQQNTESDATKDHEAPTVIDIPMEIDVEKEKEQEIENIIAVKENVVDEQKPLNVNFDAQDASSSKTDATCGDTSTRQSFFDNEKEPIFEPSAQAINEKTAEQIVAPSADDDGDDDSIEVLDVIIAEKDPDIDPAAFVINAEKDAFVEEWIEKYCLPQQYQVECVDLSDDEGEAEKAEDFHSTTSDGAQKKRARDKDLSNEEPVPKVSRVVPDEESPDDQPGEDDNDDEEDGDDDDDEQEYHEVDNYDNDNDDDGDCILLD